ncbi:MAG: transketolase family protein [Christensenellales bacterium]|jgi:transketolase
MSYNGSREAFITALTEMVLEDPRIMLVSADSMLAARAVGFSREHANNFVEVGIAEQCAVNVAAGLATTGQIPFLATYAGFITMRACEQVRTFVAYPNLNVKLVGLNAGMLGGEREGVTHQFYEDIGILRSIPNVTIVCPSDQSQVYQAAKAAAKVDGPCYIRSGSGREPVVFTDEVPEFVLGKARILREYGSDVAVFTHGFVLDRAIRAVESLKTMGINATLVEVHTIRPLDEGLITSVLMKCGKAITFEDHNINGGLGSAVAEVIAEHQSARLVRIALTTFPESGTPDDLLKKYGIDSPDIIQAAVGLMS